MFVALIVLLASLGSTVAAEDRRVLDEVVVTASRVEARVLDAPGFATVITSEDFASAGVKNLADALASSAGVVINDYGPEGSVKTLSIRGSTSAQVLVLIDGVRVNSARDGGVDVSTLPLDRVERIEVLRGGVSSLYGSDALGGVINIITKRPTRNEFRFRVVNGSYLPLHATRVSEGGAEAEVDANLADLFDTQKFELFGTLKVGEGGLSAGGSLTRAANGFTWYDSDGIDGYRRRNHAAYEAASGNVGMDFPVAGGRLSFKGEAGRAHREVPGQLEGFSLSTDAEQTDSQAAVTIAFAHDEFFSANHALDFKTYFRHTRLTFDDPDDFFPMADRHGSFALGVDVQGDLAVADFAALIYGASVTHEEVDSTTIATKKRTNLAGFLSAPVTVGPLTLTPSVRGDWYSDVDAALTGRLAAVWFVLDDLAVKASGAYSYRAPTLNDLYWPSDPFTSGNEDLDPETAWNADLGASYVSETAEVHAFAFVRYTLDQITWVEAGPFFYTPENIGRTLAPGAEVEAQVKPVEWLRLSGAYTFVNSFVLEDAVGEYDFADDLRVPFVPRHRFSVRVGYQDAAQTAGVSWVGESRKYSDTANTKDKDIDAYITVDLDYRRRVTDQVTASVSVKNLFGAVYETQRGYVMPPFSVWTGVEVKL